jgi:hypothetical protein
MLVVVAVVALCLGVVLVALVVLVVVAMGLKLEQTLRQTHSPA